MSTGISIVIVFWVALTSVNSVFMPGDWELRTGNLEPGTRNQELGTRNSLGERGTWNREHGTVLHQVPGSGFRGAKGGTRTPIPFRVPDPKSGASASSATFA